MSLGWAFETGARLVSAAVLGRGVPFQVTISVTYRCNKKCVYCSLPDHPVSELEATEWRAILARLKRAGTRRILLYGGEPLLNTDFIARIMDNIEAKFVLQTNGLLMARLEQEHSGGWNSATRIHANPLGSCNGE